LNQENYNSSLASFQVSFIIELSVLEGTLLLLLLLLSLDFFYYFPLSMERCNQCLNLFRTMSNKIQLCCRLVSKWMVSKWTTTFLHIISSLLPFSQDYFPDSPASTQRSDSFPSCRSPIGKEKSLLYFYYPSNETCNVFTDRHYFISSSHCFHGCAQFHVSSRIVINSGCSTNPGNSQKPTRFPRNV